MPACGACRNLELGGIRQQGYAKGRAAGMDEPAARKSRGKSSLPGTERQLCRASAGWWHATAKARACHDAQPDVRAAGETRGTQRIAPDRNEHSPRANEGKARSG